jgi:hypothetical protein
MIKKAIHIFIAIYFLTTAIGVSLQINHCDEQTFSAKMVMTEDCSCAMACGMCEQETRYFHLQADFIVDQIRTNHLPLANDYGIIPGKRDFNNESLIGRNTLAVTGFYSNENKRRLALFQSFLC